MNKPFKSLLQNHTPLEKALEKSAVITINGIDANINENSNPQTCRADLLPWMAWGLGVDFWKDGWSDQVKRDVVANAINIHRQKGTIGSVVSAIKATGVSAKVLIGDVPHSFTVDISSSTLLPSKENVNDIVLQIKSVSPARCAYKIAFSTDILCLSACKVGMMQVVRDDDLLH